jgi:hypothetical protein
MERAKTIIIAGIGAFAALTIYGAAATKKASSENGRTNRLARIEALMNEGSAKYRPSFFRREVKRHVIAERIAGLEPVKTVTEVAPTAPATPDPKAEEAKKAAEKKAADEKKKKEDEAKKKKKKKKKKGDTTPDASAPADQSAKSDATDDKKTDNPTAIAASGGTTMSYYAQAPADPNKMPETVDEWITYLSVYPSNEKTNKFIQLAQVNSVKGDVFFPVCEKLLSMDQKLQESSVMALGSVMNVTSFEYLANVANEATFSEKLKNQASAYLNQYARVEYVRFAGAAVLSKDSVAANSALRILDRSLPNLRTAAAATATATVPATTAARAPASTVGKIYEAILADLNEASRSGIDSSVRSTAQTMASQIQTLLASIDPTPSKTAAL